MQLASANMMKRFCAATPAVRGARLFHATPLALVCKGKVISWMAGRGFGFIEDHETKKQHFTHFSSLKIEAGGYRAVNVGQEVEFDTAVVDGRSRAENVTGPGGQPLPSGVRPDGATGDRGQQAKKAVKKKVDHFSDDF